MKNTYLQASLTLLNKINVMLFTGIVLPNNPVFFVIEEDYEPRPLKITRHTSNNNISIFELEMEKEYVYGHRYVVVLEGFPLVNLDVSEAINFPDFDRDFTYDGDDLGAIYHVEKTDFSVWAPLASQVILRIEIDGKWEKYPMARTEKGVYRYSVNGDLLNVRYQYLITNSGVTVATNDIWGKGASLNSEYSAVVDPLFIKNMPLYSPKTIIKDNVDAIIYETCVRDFTEDKSADIINKGKFLGLVEEGRKTKKNHPAGLDYLKLLGITHVQLLPIIDFFGNDDVKASKGYNWGYNPISFFAIEGSYSTKPELPMNRLIEFKEMVETLHKNDIRVVMDVVYNHVYEFMYTCFQNTIPNYFFRHRNNGLPSCASGCGNDIASEKPMVRKAIIDSVKYFIDVFNIDGYRFDLMGLLDINTINQAYQECKNLKSDILFYGEGWNMGLELPFEKKACAENADKMPGIAFFNDLFRDVIKGGNFKNNINEKGYVGGRLDNQNVVNYAIRGSAIDDPFKHRFLDINQSLNYVECHDNNTLFDKLTFSNGYEDETTLLSRITFANSVLLHSLGMPLIHMGQEIGLSKSGLDNTYNVPKINNMDWHLVDERFEMVLELVNLIKIRKLFFSKLAVDNREKINEIFETQYWNNGVLAFYSDKEEYLGNFKKVYVLINPTLDKKVYSLDDYYQLLVDPGRKGEAIIMKNGIIPPLKIQILVHK